MTNFESEEFEKALKDQNFCDFEIEVLLTILKGEGQYAQEDILYIHPSRVQLLRKLGWYKRFKTAAHKANIHINLVDYNTL